MKSGRQQLRLPVPKVIATLPGVAEGIAALRRAFPTNRYILSLAYRVGAASGDSGTSRLRAARLVGGVRLWVDFSEHMFRQIYFFGTHEPELSQLLLALAKPGQTWVDIGANIGVFTMTLAGRVGPTGRVVAFEPSRRLTRMIDRSVELNRFNNVDVRCMALGAESGTAILHVPRSAEQTPGGSGRASILAQWDLVDVVEEEVPVTKLDVELRDFADIFGMKIDVEGFEKAVLEGGAKLFSERPPKVVIFEASGLPEALATPGQLVTIFEDYGYACYAIPTLERIDDASARQWGLCDNVLAVHENAQHLLAELRIQPANASHI
jgi:FkbM family methyltransferase